MQIGISMRPSRQLPLLAQIIALLRKSGGELWLADGAGIALASDGSGPAGDGAVAGFAAGRVGGVAAVQATSSRKPLLQRVGGRWQIKFDGADDALATAGLPSVAAETFGFVYTAPAIASGQFPLSRRNAATSIGSAFYLNGTSNAVCFINGNGAAVTGAVVAPGAVAVVSAVGKVGTLAVRVNGVDGTGVAYGSYASGTGGIVLGNSQDFARPFGGALHAAWYVPGVQAEADRRLLDVLLGRLFGVGVTA
ncbi:hypothetical protein [Vogesella urethralis]|uniref:hypothetical protein n=1 Tax=Vogesella urethralis TaxID=2592656 RepID=UPI00118485AB|nr:hypothetical protein [Vogesella urethralis]